MSCDQYLELISARLDGELTQDEQAQLSTHLDQCPHCRAIVHDLDEIHTALSSLPQAEVPAHFTQQVMDRVRDEREWHNRHKPARRRWLNQLATAAACLALCVGAWQLTGGIDMEGSGGAAAPGAESYAGGNQHTSQSGYHTADSATTPDSSADGAFSSNAPASKADRCTVTDQRAVPVTAGSGLGTPAAWVLGSVQSLSDLAARFPGDDLSQVTAQYGSDFFANHRLLAVVVDSQPGQSCRVVELTTQEVTVELFSSLSDTATTWLILAQTEGLDDGSTLNVSITN